MSGGEKKKESSEFEKGNVQELVSYQVGSVVSREVVARETGTVTAFAFDEGQGLSEHTAPFDALVHIVDGEAEVSIDGKPNRLAKDDMILLPAGIPHALRAIARFKMLLVMIRGE